METVSGLASSVTHGFDIDPGSGATWRTATFKIDQHQVRIDSHSRIGIDNGERVVVIGRMRGGQLKSLAYKNLTTQAQGDSGYLSSGLVGGVLLIVALSLLAASEVLAALLFASVGAIFIHYSIRVAVALRDIKNEASQETPSK